MQVMSAAADIIVTILLEMLSMCCMYSDARHTSHIRPQQGSWLHQQTQCLRPGTGTHQDNSNAAECQHPEGGTHAGTCCQAMHMEGSHSCKWTSCIRSVVGPMRVALQAGRQDLPPSHGTGETPPLGFRHACRPAQQATQMQCRSCQACRCRRMLSGLLVDAAYLLPQPLP